MKCRPSYRKLSSLRKQFPDIPLLALTATAVPKYCNLPTSCLPLYFFVSISWSHLFIFSCTRVQKDVVSSLCLRNPVILRASFNRPNIFYEGNLLILLIVLFAGRCKNLSHEVALSIKTLSISISHNSSNNNNNKAF